MITITPASTEMQNQPKKQNATQDILLRQAIVPVFMPTMSAPATSVPARRELGPDDRLDDLPEDEEGSEQPEMDATTSREDSLFCEAQAQEHDEVIDLVYEDSLMRLLPWYR